MAFIQTHCDLLLGGHNKCQGAHYHVLYRVMITRLISPRFDSKVVLVYFRYDCHNGNSAVCAAWLWHCIFHDVPVSFICKVGIQDLALISSFEDFRLLHGYTSPPPQHPYIGGQWAWLTASNPAEAAKDFQNFQRCRPGNEFTHWSALQKNADPP